MWIDDSNALNQLNILKASDAINNTLFNDIKNIIENGYTIIQNCSNTETIDKFVNDFNNTYGIIDTRVVNFHSHNNNTLDLVCNSYIDTLLSTMFGTKQTVYTSLTFGKGTQQGIHRDTPHFYTNPIDQYFGVWYALEDIKIESGPLMYYKNGHLLNIPNGYDIYNELYNDSEKTHSKIDCCLQKYNLIVSEACKEHKLESVNIESITQPLNKGDVIVWHPKLPHGGSFIINKELTRKSIVTHNIPIHKQVFNASHFFGPTHTTEYINNECFYKYKKYNDVFYIDGMNHFVQKSYL
jgi:phytanoyl-CoA hydroxylase